MANIVQLAAEHFNSRICFGGCLININGETFDCLVEKEGEFAFPLYTVYEKGSHTKLCDFHTWHISSIGMDRTLYSIEGASKCGGAATLLVPLHGLLKTQFEESLLGEHNGEI